jgi:hypothetical protein
VKSRKSPKSGESKSKSKPKQRGRKETRTQEEIAELLRSDLSKLFPARRYKDVYVHERGNSGRNIRVDTEFAMPDEFYRGHPAEVLFRFQFGDTLNPQAKSKLDKSLSSVSGEPFHNHTWLSTATLLERLAVANSNSKSKSLFVDDRLLGCMFNLVGGSPRANAYVQAESALYTILSGVDVVARARILRNPLTWMNYITGETFFRKKWEMPSRQGEFLTINRPGLGLGGGITCAIPINPVKKMTLPLTHRPGLIWQRGDPIFSARYVLNVQVNETDDHEQFTQTLGQAFQFILHYVEVWSTLFQSKRIAQFFAETGHSLKGFVDGANLLANPVKALEYVYSEWKMHDKVVEKVQVWIDAMKSAESIVWPEPTDLDKIRTEIASKTETETVKTQEKPADPESESEDVVELRNKLRKFNSDGKQDHAWNRKLVRMSPEQLKAEYNRQKTESNEKVNPDSEKDEKEDKKEDKTESKVDKKEDKTESKVDKKEDKIESKVDKKDEEEDKSESTVDKSESTVSTVSQHPNLTVDKVDDSVSKSDSVNTVPVSEPVNIVNDETMTLVNPDSNDGMEDAHMETERAEDKTEETDETDKMKEDDADETPSTMDAETRAERNQLLTALTKTTKVLGSARLRKYHTMSIEELRKAVRAKEALKDQKDEKEEGSTPNARSRKRSTPISALSMPTSRTTRSQAKKQGRE